MDIAQKIAHWSDILRDISANGLKYAENVYDRDRYKALQDLAVEMLSEATGTPVGKLEPLRAPVLSHPTPLTVADAAIIDSDERILLIQRSDNGRWAMPGGFLEVGETAAEGAAREAFEEAGIRSRPVGLAGIYDSRMCGAITVHHMYMVTVLCEPGGRELEEASHRHEVIDIGWFPEDDLPTTFNPSHDIRTRDAFAVRRGEKQPHFDI